MTNTYFVNIPRLSINLMTSVMHTAVVEKYRSPVEMVRVYRSATVYVAATSVITVRQYSLKTTLTFSEERRVMLMQLEGLCTALLPSSVTGSYKVATCYS